jgi:hypothetical protein
MELIIYKKYSENFNAFILLLFFGYVSYKNNLEIKRSTKNQKYKIHIEFRENLNSVLVSINFDSLDNSLK